MIGDFLKEWLKDEKQRKQADDQRIFAGLQAFVIDGTIIFYSINKLGKLKTWTQGVIFTLVLLSIGFWVLGIVNWRKAYFGYKYMMEATPQEIQKYISDLREENKNEADPEGLAEEKFSSYLERHRIKILDSYVSISDKRTKLYSTSNKHLFYSFILSLISVVLILAKNLF